MKVPFYLIKYLEESHGLKFKLIPKMHETSKRFSHSRVIYEGRVYRDDKTNRIIKKVIRLTKSDIFIQNILFKVGVENSRDLVILHEAREVLLRQHDKRIRDLTLKERALLHFKALSYESKDKKFLNKIYGNKLYKYKPIPN